RCGACCRLAISYVRLFVFNGWVALYVLHSFPTRRSSDLNAGGSSRVGLLRQLDVEQVANRVPLHGVHHEAGRGSLPVPHPVGARSEEHTSELQSRENVVCRLLLEKKKS